MKKLLLLLAIAMLSCGAALADTPQRFGKTVGQAAKTAFNPLSPRQAAPARRADEGGFTIQFSDELYSWYFLVQQNKITYKGYLYIPGEMATAVAGNKITSITFSMATDFSLAPTRQAEVWVSEDLDAEPVTITSCTAIDSYSQYANGGDPYQTVALDEPYTIREGQGFYFGFTIKNCRYSSALGADYPVAVDYQAPNGFSGMVDILDTNGELLGTLDMGEDMGTNLFIAATTVGEHMGFENLFLLGNISIGTYTLPVCRTDSDDPILLPIKNIGGNELTSFEYSLDVNGVKGEPQVAEISVKPQAIEYLGIPAPQYALGRNELTLNIYKINGVDTPISSSASCLALEDEGYDRKFVVEEGTGTWCGYCPRGIVGLEKMSEQFPDEFIGIAVHSGDAMAAESYQTLMYYFEGFPSCIINRDPIFVTDPSYNYLSQYYDLYWKDQRAPVKVDMTVEATDGGYDVTTETTFAFSEANADYRLAFVILEDGLTGTQTNNYAGYPNELEWWGSQGANVPWTYEHTAVDIFDFMGLEGSIPTSIMKDQTLTYKTSLSDAHVTDKSNTTIVALLLDAKTNVILNATRVKAADFGEQGETGTPDVNADGSVDVADVVAVYNIMAEGGDDDAGDVNGDGSIDVADVVAIYNAMAAK